MAANVASKNLYELLGNDHDEDSDKEPEPPVKVVDKTPARTDKRNAPREAPTGGVSAGGARGGRRGDLSGNEAAFRDHKGSTSNRGKPVEDVRNSEQRGGRAPGTYSDRGGRGRGRGGRGGPRGDYDRHSRGLAADSEKQAGHGWGANEGGAELADEQAGEAIAKADEKEALTGDGTDAPVDADGNKLPEAEAEPEDNSISYADYLVQQAEKLSLAAPEGRKPNEGTKEDKKWANAKAIAKEEEEAFIAGSGGKAKRERERKQKQVIDIDQRFVEAPERGGRADGSGRGRGRGRGDGSRGRGDGFRGGRGDARGGRGGEFRGRGRGDGPPRGAPRGGPRGGAPINTEDTNAFPSLGS